MYFAVRVKVNVYVCNVIYMYPRFFVNSSYCYDLRFIELMIFYWS